MKNILDFIDKYNLVVHKRPDSEKPETGDSARETGTLAIFDALNGTERYLGFTNIEISPGILIRHPEPSIYDDWHKDPNEFSRDQWTAIIQACCLYAHLKPLAKRLLTQQLKRFGFFQNKDVCTYEWVWYIRALDAWYLYPVLLILDSGLIINSFIRLIFPKIFPAIVHDDINHTTSCLVAMKKYWTPNAWLAWQIYKFRPQPSVEKIEFRGHAILNAWKLYYHNPWNPPMDDIAIPVIQKYL